MDLDCQRICHMAKWVCIFCFEMKGAAIFDWTVLLCDHLVCIKCFKKNADFLKTMHTCHCGTMFPESAYKYIVTNTQWERGRCRDIINNEQTKQKFLYFVDTRHTVVSPRMSTDRLVGGISNKSFGKQRCP